MRKKGARVNIWGDRYFALRGQTLYYYLKSPTTSDKEPKGFFTFLSTCRVSEISSEDYRKKKQYVFRISWAPPAGSQTGAAGSDEVSLTLQGTKGSASSSPSEKDKGGWFSGWFGGGKTTKATCAGASATPSKQGAAGTTSPSDTTTTTSSSVVDRDRQLILACDTYHDAQMWVHAIDCQLLELQSKSTAGGGGLRSSKKYAPPPGIRIRDVEAWIRTTKWELHSVFDGIRLLKPSGSSGAAGTTAAATATSKGRGGEAPIVSSGSSATPVSRSWGDEIFRTDVTSSILPCLRVNQPVKCSPEQALHNILDMTSASLSGPIQSIRVVEKLEPYLDIVHVVLESMELYPTRIAPRDFCLMRYWRQNADGSYIICMDSTLHHDCPVVDGYVRGDLHSDGANTVASSVDEARYDEESIIFFVAQLDPRGWIWTKGGYRDRVLERFMMHILDLKDSIDVSRFATVAFDPEDYEYIGEGAGAGATSSEDVKEAAERVWMGNTPPAQCPPEMWGEPDASSFKVRGPDYLKSSAKIVSPPSLFKLIALDLFDTGETMKNICAHPRNRVCQALKRGEKTFVFVMNIMIPGPPYLSFVAYWEADRELLEADTPFGRIARLFFFGNDNDFRNNRFKLIPKIVAGNFIVKQAVPQNTPTLLGNKLNQYYYKGDNYFELDVDVGSSAVAKYTVGIAQSYSKTMHCDMGLCLQGNDANELPEVLFGGCSAINLDTSKAVKI
eukprot:GSChrysophyteH2.ASY1.ANO1.1457.1 assembled CDS